MTIGDIMDGVVFVDREGLIAVINPVAEDLLDVRGLLAVGKTPGQVAADDQRELAKALVVEIEAASVAGTAHRTVEIHHGERDLHYVDLRVSTVRDAEDRPAGKLVVLRDVTKEFKADQLRNQYLSIVAHELRTPLTGIKTYSTMLAKRSLGELQPNQATAIESIREQCIRLEHQIDKLVNLGHIDSSNYARDLDEIDVIAVLRGAVEPFRGVAADAGVKLELEEPTDGCKVRADRVDLGRALKAIIENAIKFTPEGGRVAVSAEVADGWVTFVVSDSGIGIDPRYQRRIFEKFFQVEDPLTRYHGGAGLGLFVAQAALQAHGSRIEVVSGLGTGARFRFSLPLFEEEVTEAPRPSRSAAGAIVSVTGDTR